MNVAPQPVAPRAMSSRQRAPRITSTLALLLTLSLLACLPACSWFHRLTPPAAPTQLIIAGAPLGSRVYIDGTPAGSPASAVSPTQVLDVTAGEHTVTIQQNDHIVYREDLYVGVSQRREVHVLAGD